MKNNLDSKLNVIEKPVANIENSKENTELSQKKIFKLVGRYILLGKFIL